MADNIRYALGSKGVVTYGLETNKYEKASSPDLEFGLTPNDIDIPNENPHTAMATGGNGRKVYLNSPDEKNYNFSVGTVVFNEDIPFEIAIGSRTTTKVDVNSSGTDDYKKIVWNESDRLETCTIRHLNADLDHVQYFIGCKASVSLSWDTDEHLEAEFDITPAKADYDPSESPSSFSPSLSQDKVPFRATHQGNLKFTNPQDDTLIREVATVMAGELSIDNGLEPNHHGNGRDAYSVSEETGADGKHEHSFDVKVSDTEMFKRAFENDVPVDAEIPFIRDTETIDGSEEVVDGLFIRFKNATILNADIPYTAEGTVEGSIELAPREIEIEMRVPL